MSFEPKKLENEKIIVVDRNVFEQKIIGFREKENKRIRGFRSVAQRSVIATRNKVFKRDNGSKVE